MEGKDALLLLFDLFVPVLVRGNSTYAGMTQADKLDFIKLYTKAIAEFTTKDGKQKMLEGKGALMVELTAAGEKKATWCNLLEETVEMMPDSKVAAIMAFGTMEYPEGFNEEKKQRLSAKGPRSSWNISLWISMVQRIIAKRTRNTCLLGVCQGWWTTRNQASHKLG